jgi:hypothetical protein
MVTVELKRRILKNQFVYELRHLQIDRGSLQELLAALAELAVVWRSQEVVEKDIAQELYGVMTIIRNMLVHFERHETLRSRVAELEEISIDVDRLILKCFATQ